MPKITDAHRDLKRAQILEAAWRCFYREGVQGTTMEEIIKEADMSASAMYRYFTGKDDIIFTAITTSLTGLEKLLEPVLAGTEASLPPELVERVTATIEAFTKRRGFNLSSIAIHGWSEAQRDERVRLLIRDHYLNFRKRLQERARTWQKTGALGPKASASDIAQTLQALILGFVVQAAIMRDADPRALARGLLALNSKPASPSRD